MLTASITSSKQYSNVLPTVSGNYQVTSKVSTIPKREGMKDSLFNLGIGGAVLLAVFITGSPTIERSTGVNQQIPLINSNVKSYNKGTRIYNGIPYKLEASQMAPTSRNNSKSNNGRLVQSSTSHESFVARSISATFLPDEKIESVVLDKPFSKGRVIKSTVTRGFINR